jgi:hypothetical protein
MTLDDREKYIKLCQFDRKVCMFDTKTRVIAGEIEFHTHILTKY